MIFKLFFMCLVLRFVSEAVSHEVRNEEETYCYANEEFESPQYNQFGTKTAYIMIKETLAETTIIGCNPAKIWLLSRHGAVNPSEIFMNLLATLEETKNKIVEQYEVDGELQFETEELCDKDLEKLKSWKFDQNRTSHAEVLTDEGWKELRTLARDYKAAFPTLFEQPDYFLFRHTVDQFTNESFQGFVGALIESGEEIDPVVELEEDMLLKFYEHCDKWQENKNKQNESDSQLYKFEHSDTFDEIIREITGRLKLTDQLTIEEVIIIWDICRFDKAWNNTEKSPWCAAFLPHHINVLEHREDLKYYFESGRGAEINKRVACKTVFDMITHLEDEEEDSPKMIANFAHESTIQLLLTALGVNDDMLAPSATNFNEETENGTRWRSSKISPFAANLAVVKYNCTDNEYRVKFFLNQKPVEFDWCEKQTTCTLTEVVEQYSSFKEADCETYFCSGEAKIIYGVLTIVVNLIFIYFN